MLEEMSRHFRPEFLNRVDEMIVFHGLSQEHLKQIAEIQLQQLRERQYDLNRAAEQPGAHPRQPE